MTIKTRLRIGLSVMLLVLSAVMLTGQQAPIGDQYFEWLKQRVLPEVPKLLTPTDGQANVPVNAGLTFRALGAESCDIEAGAYPTGTPSTMPSIANAVPCGSFTYQTQLASSTRYCWRARGRNLAGTSAFSATSCFITAIAACVPVNCVQSPFVFTSGTWGACINGQETRQELWTRNVITPANSCGTACGPATEQRTSTRPCTAPPPSGNVITLDPSQVFQTMRGWEVVMQAEQDFQPVRFPIYAPKVLDEAIALGIDRVRVEVRSGSENTVDYYQNNQMGPTRYQIVNDNADPNVINAAGFKWTEYNRQVDTLVNPLRTRMIAKGESLYVVVTYVSFAPANLHHNTPAEYAEFMLALFQQSQARYGWVPSAIEVWLEPDNISGGHPTNLGQMIVAAGARLAAAGFKPDFIAPSNTNMTTAWTWSRDYLLNVPNVKTYLKELAYHRYSGVSAASLQGLASLAQAQGLSTSMLECWVYQGSSCVNNRDVLHEDLKVGNASAWEHGVIAGTGGGETTLLHVDAANNVAQGPLTRYAQQYYRHVRLGARRIGASSNSPTFDPLGFINANGTQVVVVKATAAGSLSVAGLPAGSYGSSYTTSSAQATGADQTIAAGQSVTATIPAAGVLTVFAKTIAQPPPACAFSPWAFVSTTTCVNNQRTETWTRTVTAGPSSCGPLSETRPVACGATGSRTLLTLTDLTYRGFARLPDAPGTGYTTASVGVRYVGGERRLLIADFTNAAPSGRFFADLVEYRLPTTLVTSGTAQPMVETRRWAQDWTVHDATTAWHDAANSVRLGAILWDEANGGVWYTAFGYYSQRNMPFLGFTKLNDNGTVQKFGPWWYRDNNPNDQTDLHVKRVSQYLLNVPTSSQAALGGRKHIAGANPGSIAGQGHLGPGLHALDLPALTTPANAVIPLGLRLADYSPDSPARPQHAKRDTNYTPISYPGHTATDTGLQPGGFWQMNLDQVNGCAWVETTTKEALLCFGRQVSGRDLYGWNPASTSPGWIAGTPEMIDPSRPNPDGNGYKGEFWKGAVYRYDPKQILEVAAGTRQPWNTGINPTNIGDWKAQWAGMPSGTARHIDVGIGSSLVWDAQGQELIWCNPVTAGARPTCHVWTVQ